jgi:preprotein translocase subunit Sss1
VKDGFEEPEPGEFILVAVAVAALIIGAVGWLVVVFH